MNRKLIYVVAVSFSFFVIITGLYIWKFHSIGPFDSPADWSTFASFFNGMLTPILSLINIVVLFGVGQTLHQISKDSRKHRAVLQSYNKNSEWGDLKYEINPNATVEDNLRDIEQSIKHMEKLFGMFQQSDELCEKDLYSLLEKVNANEKTVSALQNVPYYENPFVSRMWVFHNIAVPNAITMAQSTFLQLKVNVYELMAEQDPKNNLVYEKYISAQKELEEYHRDSSIVD